MGEGEKFRGEMTDGNNCVSLAFGGCSVSWYDVDDR